MQCLECGARRAKRPHVMFTQRTLEETPCLCQLQLLSVACTLLLPFALSSLTLLAATFEEKTNTQRLFVMLR